MRLLRRQHGFTLIEALVGMTLAMVVFGATLTILTVYMRQSNGVTQRFTAQNQNRLAIDRIIRQLRNVASPLTTPKLLERATPYDIVFQTIGAASGSNAAGTERVRYCIPQDSSTGSANQEELISQTQTWNTAATPADPWSSDPTITIPCPDSTFAQQPSGVVISQSVVNRYQALGPTVPSGTTRAEQPAFTYNNGLDGNNVLATDIPNISTIQVNLWVNPTPSVAGATTEIQSAAYLRNKQHAPVAQFTQSPTGGGTVILNAGTSYSPDGEQLSYSWNCTSCAAGNSLTGQQDGVVTWSPGAGVYTVTVTAKDETGLTATSSPTSVTVT